MQVGQLKQKLIWAINKFPWIQVQELLVNDFKNM
jgi:hypothetical protein